MANLGKAFGMRVRVYARPHHREWIESEGFEYAASPVEAARGADVLSPHTGLGPFDAGTGRFANASVVDTQVLSVMNDGAVLVNYDRGEVVDADALDAALSAGKVRHAAIDADLFMDPGTGELSGPMTPYLTLLGKHGDKLELLPHAAADTEHVSRVEGARQAVDQIINCIRHKSVTNLKGDLPEGYTDAGPVTVNGVGKVSPNRLSAVSGNREEIAALANLAAQLGELWPSMRDAKDADQREAWIARHGSDLIRASNTYISLIEKLGLKGPYG